MFFFKREKRRYREARDGVEDSEGHENQVKHDRSDK